MPRVNSKEGEMAHWPNVTSFILNSGDHRWNVLGVYIPPSEDDGETMIFLTEAIQYCGLHYPYILLGDLNVDLNGLEDVRADTIAAHWLCMILKMLVIISNTHVVDGHGPNNFKEGAICEVEQIMLWLKMFPIFDAGLLRFLVLTLITMQLWLKLLLAKFTFIATIWTVDTHFLDSLFRDHSVRMIYVFNI
jgi:hypothetical protein